MFLQLSRRIFEKSVLKTFDLVVQNGNSKSTKQTDSVPQNPLRGCAQFPTSLVCFTQKQNLSVILEKIVFTAITPDFWFRPSICPKSEEFEAPMERRNIVISLFQALLGRFALIWYRNRRFLDRRCFRMCWQVVCYRNTCMLQAILPHTDFL